MNRTQLLLALAIAVVVGLGLAFLASAGGLRGAGDRFRDTSAALKRMYRERAPHHQILAPPPTA